MQEKRIGNQYPRIQVEPDRTATHGGLCAELMAAYGNKLDPWQRVIVDCWLGIDEDGAYTMTSGGVAVPRQNGKNVCIEAREFFGLIIDGEKIIHTAHQVKTAKKSFMRLERMFTNDDYPEVQAEVKSIRHTNGEERIELKNGGIIEFSARSKSAARGFDGISLVVFDEAQELTDEQLEAIMSTLAASATGTRQIIYTGTPPYPNCHGTVFRRLRGEYMKDAGAHDAWHEWSVDAQSIDAIDVNNTALWYETNPALGIHLTEDFTRTELKTMSADGFARERLCWWSPVLVEQTDYVLDRKAWNKCKSSELKPNGKTAYGVKFTPDGSEVVLCGAVIPTDGSPARISLISRTPQAYGLQWLADWLNERYQKACCVVIDGKNGAQTLVEKISSTWRYKGSIVKPTTAEYITATTNLVNEVNEQTVTWYENQEQLNDSAISSVKRRIGGGWGFGGDDCAPIEGAALALWGARTSKRDPNRKQRIG